MIRDNASRSHRMTIVLAAASALVFSAVAQADVVWKGEPVAGGCAGDDGFHKCIITPHVDLELPTGSNGRYCQPALPEPDWLDDTLNSGLSSWLTATVADTRGQGKDRSGVMGGPGWDTLLVDTRARMWDWADGNLFNNGGDNEASGSGFAELWDDVTILPDNPGAGRDFVDAIVSVDVYLAGYAGFGSPIAHMLIHDGTVSLPVEELGTLSLSCLASVSGDFGPDGLQSATGEFSVLWDGSEVGDGFLTLAHFSAVNRWLMGYGGDLSLNVAPWVYLGSQGQWYENEPGGFPSWYAGIFCTLSLPAGYHFVPEPCTLLLLALGMPLIVGRRR